MLFLSEQKWKIYKENNGWWSLLASNAYTFNPNIWYTLTLIFSGNTITAGINNATVGFATDSSIKSGSISLISKGLTEYDNVVVSNTSSSPTPTPTSTPTPLPTVTPTPTDTPTPTPTTIPPTPTSTPTPLPTVTPTPTGNGLVVTSKIQSGISGGQPNNQLETDISWTDPITNNGWQVGLIPGYGGADVSPWYEIANNATSVTQTSLATTIPDGFLHLLDNKGGTFQGTEDQPYTLSELSPTGTGFRRYYSAQTPTSGVDANGFQYKVNTAVYAGNPGFLVHRIDIINPGSSSINLAGFDGIETALIGGLQQAGESVWSPVNGGYGTVGGSIISGWPASLTSVNPDFVYILPNAGSGITTGVIAVQKTSLAALGATSIQIQYLQNSNRLKLKVQGNLSSFPANTTFTLYYLQVLRKNLTSTESQSIASDYLNPDSPVMSTGTFNSFSYDEGLYQMTASNNKVQFTPTITGNVNQRWINIYKIANFTNVAISSISIGGSTLTVGTDYITYVDTVNQVAYVKLMHSLVQNGAMGNQLNNGLITIQ
jgi:hypothetical protein